MPQKNKFKKNISKKQQAPKNIPEHPAQMQDNNAFLEEQRMHDQSREQYTKRLQESSPKEHGENYAKKQVNKIKDYGVQKGREAINSGANYANKKMSENPRILEAVSKAQEAKEKFENRMSSFKENAQNAPIKQEQGESSYAFRRRQQKEDDESPDNIKKRSLRSVAGQRLRTDVNKRIRKTLKDNPRTAATLARANEIKKLAALKAQKFSNRAKELSRKAKMYNERFKKIKNRIDLKQRLEDEIKKYTIRLLWPAISGAFLILAKLFIVVFAIVVIVSAFNSACKSNPLFDAACSLFTGGAL